jgi:DNA primase
MNNEGLIIGLLETMLGKSKAFPKTGDYGFYCPVCNHKNPKLIVNVKSGKYNCFTCHPPLKGKSPVSLLKKIGAPSEKVAEMRGYLGELSKEEDKVKVTTVSLPKEFVSLLDPNETLEKRHAIVYAKSRGITEEDIVKYNIGYCASGKYKNRLIVPSYNKRGIPNYFIARSFEKNPVRKIDAPTCDKAEIIGLENTINWSVPIILCEGIFDAIAIKRNAIPLFGKTMPKSLMLKLAETQVKTVYLALDRDAFKSALYYAEELVNMGKEVYLLELEDKDPSDLGFERVTELLHKARPLTFSDFLLKKMMLKS